MDHFVNLSAYEKICTPTTGNSKHIPGHYIRLATHHFQLPYSRHIDLTYCPNAQLVFSDPLGRAGQFKANMFRLTQPATRTIWLFLSYTAAYLEKRSTGIGTQQSHTRKAQKTIGWSLSKNHSEGALHQI